MRVVDNFSRGKRANLASVAGSSRIEIHEVDVTDFSAVRRAMEGIEWVFHLAALADIVPSIQRPLEYFRTNVDGTVNVTHAATEAGVSRFVYAASSSCYGIPETYPTPETTPVAPQYPYALTKYLGEEVVRHWAQVYQLPAVSLRLFNVFGPRARTSGTYGAVFGVFLAQMLAGKPFTVVGDGTQTRDFTFVTDVADAFVAAASAPVSGAIFNVGSGGTYSVNRVVELLGGPVVHVPKRPGEPDCTFADITKIRTVLDWKPRVTFEEGVAALVARLDDFRDAPVWDTESIAVATREWFTYLGR